MSERLAHRELRNRSSQVLRDVANGATYEITNHGEVVAVLSPPPAGSELRVRAATVRGGFSGLRRYVVEESSASILDELRGDR